MSKKADHNVLPSTIQLAATSTTPATRMTTSTKDESGTSTCPMIDDMRMCSPNEQQHDIESPSELSLSEDDNEEQEEETNTARTELKTKTTPAHLGSVVTSVQFPSEDNDDETAAYHSTTYDDDETTVMVTNVDRKGNQALDQQSPTTASPRIIESSEMERNDAEEQQRTKEEPRKNNRSWNCYCYDGTPLLCSDPGVPFSCCFLLCFCLFTWFLLLCDGICFLVFALVLLPGFVRFGWYYWIQSSLSQRRVSVQYGDGPRQTVDVYYPTSNTIQEQERTTTPHHPERRRRQTRTAYNTTTNPQEEEEESPCIPLLSGCCQNHEHNLDEESPPDPHFNHHDTTQEQEHSSDHTTTATTQLAPVVLFVPGGAWMIGYKMWAALTARVLSQFGIVTVVADYRNHPWFLLGCGCCSCCTYPQIPDMVDDISAVLQWTFEEIAHHGGNPHQITVVGQSAGGHLVTTAILRRALELQREETEEEQQSASSSSSSSSLSSEAQSSFPTRNSPKPQPSHSQTQTGRTAIQEVGEEAAAASSVPIPMPDATARTITTSDEQIRTFTWKPTDLCGIVSLSAPVSFASMEQAFRRHGLSSRNVLWKGMFGRTNQNPKHYDPLTLVETQLQQYRTVSRSSSTNDDNNIINLPPAPLELPPWEVWHGGRDKTVPWEPALRFAQAVQQLQQLQHQHQQSQQQASSNALDLHLTGEEAPTTTTTNTTTNFRLFDRWTHTSCILEDPLSGCHEFHHELFQMVQTWTSTQTGSNNNTPPILEWCADHAVLQPMWCPRALAQVGQWCIPF